MTDDDFDDRPLRDRLIGRAKEAEKLTEPNKRWAVKSLVHERFRTTPAAARELAEHDAPAPCITDREIFEESYGDPTGRAYWLAWLKGVQDWSELADLLATHSATSEIAYAHIKRELKQALLRASPERDFHEDIESLIADPNTRHLVPETLSAFMSVETVAARDDGSLAHTGAPGRPTSAHLVEQEMNRRAESGLTLSTMSKEAEVLAGWLSATHPGIPPMTSKTIKNSLGSKYKKIPKIIPK